MQSSVLHHFATLGRSLALASLWFTSGIAQAHQAESPQGPAGAPVASRPGDNFYRYANDGWVATPGATGDPAANGITPLLAARNRERVRQLLAQVRTKPLSADERRIGDYHASLAADDPAAAERALAAVRQELKAIAAWKDRGALATWLARHLSLDDGSASRVEGLFGIWVHQGFHDPAHHSVHFVQGGLGLWERDAYMGNSPAQVQAREAYRARVARLLALGGQYDAPRAAAAVLALETAIAQAHAPQADIDDVHRTDNAWRPADFERLAPGLPWASFFRAAGLGQARHFTVWQPGAITGLSALVARHPLEAWQSYAAYHLLAHYAPVLPSPYREEVGAGADAVATANATAREALATTMTTQALGPAIGKAYTARHFPPATQQAAQAMVERIRAAFGPRIAALSWLSTDAKAIAQRKLQQLQLGVGMPRTWPDYRALKVVRGDAYGNLRRAEAWAWAQALAKLTRPVDPAEWALLPQTTGAILNFSPNSMQFASGLFQPPYFDPQGDIASNYGSAGAGLAHEVAHSFDALGRDYDERGNLVTWWSAADTAAFKAATAPLARQIATECPLPGACVSAERTLGESTADLAGLHAAHDAYVAALGGKPDAVINGLTGEQRFFIAFARRWHRTLGDEALKKYIASDTHLPPESRANAVRHLDAWYAAFNIQPGDKLYLPPEQRARVW